MEKGANNCSGFCVSDKKSSFNSDVSLMKLQSTEPLFPSKICMMACHEENNLDRFCGSVGDDGGGGGGGTNGGGLGPSNCNSGGANEVVGNIYLDNVSSSRGGGENFARSTNLQPFDISPYYSTTPNKYPADIVGMMASVSLPFTTAQWKELERQAMIYKYMIASVPVPPDLLFPLSRNFADSSTTLTAAAAGAIYNVRYSKNGDPEPGRCKRTDGKKWRCSRDVAPHQKYCERHLHRGRPRSRKPVEVKNTGETQKKTRLEQCPLPTVQANSNTSQQFTAAYEPQLLLNSKTELSVSSPSYKETNRDMGLIIEGEMVALDGAEQQWEHLMEAQMGLTNESSSIYNFHQDYIEHQPLNLLSYSNFSGQEMEAPPSGFIDAWSIDNPNFSSNKGNAESSVSPDQSNLSPPLNLSMTMAAGNLLDEEMRKMGNGVKDCNDHKTKDSRYLGAFSWSHFAQGGPLGEALQPGSVAVGGSNPTSPYRSISSTPATTVSSPSGVLHRTLFSHSDSSVCNSPTLAAPPSEIAFQWLN